MKRNVGGIDRIVRMAVGFAILSLVFVGPQSLWGLIGLVPLITGLVGFCALYKMCGMNTCVPGANSKGCCD